jgi:hypothetical protein
MNPVKIIESAFLDGLNLAITPEGQLHYSGHKEVVARWLPAIRENKTGILAELARFNKPASEVANVKTDILSRWWRFHYADRRPKDAFYCPPVTRAEALAGEPGAINAESFEPTPRQPDEPLSETDKATIRKWLADIDETDEDIINAVLNQCQTDEEAREAFLQLAEDRDDMRRWSS